MFLWKFIRKRKAFFNKNSWSVWHFMELLRKKLKLFYGKFCLNHPSSSCYWSLLDLSFCVMNDQNRDMMISSISWRYDLSASCEDEQIQILYWNIANKDLHLFNNTRIWCSCIVVQSMFNYITSCFLGEFAFTSNKSFETNNFSVL